jgi:hypothetical protein
MQLRWVSRAIWIAYIILKGFTKIPGVIFIKFTMGDVLPTDTNAGRCPMNHNGANGRPVHSGLTHHVQHSAELLSLIDSRIQARCCIKVIQAVMILCMKTVGLGEATYP